VVVGIATLIVTIAVANPALVERWWLLGVLASAALLALAALLLLRSWLRRARAQLLAAAKRAAELGRTEAARLRAYHSGQLESYRSELDVERDKYASEKAKVDKLTVPLATLSDQVLRLFDQRVERPHEMEWGGAVAASQRALKCAAAALSHHVAKIVYYDPDYPASWVQGENAEKARDHFVGRWFVQKNAPQLASWIREVLRSQLAHRSLIVFAQDIVPDTVAEVRNETCLIRKYLDAGGRVVWRGDIPFWYQGKAGGAKDDWHGSDSSECGPWKILGVYYFNYEFKWSAPRGDVPRLWGTDLPLHITAAGRDIGLAYPRQGLDIRPAPCEDVHVSYLALRQETFRVFGSQHGSEGEFSLCWKKNFNERYPYSGFMQYVPGRFVWREVNDHFFRFAVSGWPLLFDE
jgi:hypothetical protein